MNQVPYLGSYGYVAPVVPSPSIGKQIISSPYLLIGLILFLIGLMVYVSVEQKKKKEAHLALDNNEQQENEQNGHDNLNGYGFNNFYLEN